jgi:hypothetical protein
MTVSEWQSAAASDPTLHITPQVLKKLARFEMKQQHYTRRKLFSNMIHQRPSLYKDFPLRYTLQPFFGNGDLPIILKKLFRRSPKTLTRIGKAKKVRYLPVHEVVDKWVEGRSVFSANDIFFRNLRLDKVFDCSAISDFNIIPGTPDEINYLEVATLLIGTPGCLTDSHSDDPDGSNYCIRGKKLWFIWDRKEGQKHGLQDCEYDSVYTHAGFSLENFMKLRSAHWYTVSAGQTLFLPGNFTHKVITLEKYLGISSFYFGLPNALCSLSRWKFNGTVMVNQHQQDELMERLAKQLEKTAAASRDYKRQWGFYHLKEALDVWESKYNTQQRGLLCTNPRFEHLLNRISFYSGQ